MDERARELERTWLNTASQDDADAYDRAYQRSGHPGASAPRQAALRRLQALVQDAFNPKHLLTPCCGEPVWWGHVNVGTAFTMSRPLICIRCSFIRFRDGVVLRRPEAVRGRRRHIGTLIVDSGKPPFPLTLVEQIPGSITTGVGRLHPDVPAPLPTKILAAVLRYGHEIRGLPRVTTSSLLAMPWRSTVDPQVVFLTPEPWLASQGLPPITPESRDAVQNLSQRRIDP